MFTRKSRTVTKIFTAVSLLLALSYTTIQAGSTPQNTFSALLYAPDDVTISATKTDALLNDLDSDGRADPGDTLRYTITATNGGSDPATGVTFDDTIDLNTTLVAGSVAASPVPVNDIYPQTVVGNISINSALIPFSVVSNDFLGLNPEATTISAFDALSANGGNVTMTTSGAGMGQFTYNPPAGFEGTDTFTYTLTDNANATSAATNRTATVSIPVSGMVWFINNNASACTVVGCGRLSNPFSTLAAFNTLNNGSSNNPAANDNIFIYESGTAYTGAVTLLSGQKLIGQDATATLSAITGLTPPSSSPSFPAMNSGNVTVTNLGSTVTLNTNATVRGLQINSTTSTGMNDPAGAITGVNVSEVSVTTTIGTAVSLSSLGGTLSFIRISANGAPNGINLSNTSGSFTVTGNSSGLCGGQVGGGPPASPATTTAPDTADCTGGTIQNTTGSGIVLTNASNISLTRLWLRNSGNDGVQATNVTNFTLVSSFFDNNGNALNENGLDFGDSSSITPDGLHGTGSITNSTIQNSYYNNVSIRNNGGSALTSFNITGSQFRSNPANGDANDSVFMEAGGTANMAISVSGSFFASIEGDHIQTAALNSGTLNVTLTNNTLTGGHTTPLGQGITINAATGVPGWNGRVDYDINGNNITGAVSNGVSVVLGTSSAAAVFDGFVRNNVIGTSGVSLSCSTQANGVYIDARGNGTHNSSVTNNTIRQCFDRGILTEAGDGDSVLNLTVQSNTIDQQVDVNAREAIQTNFGITSSNVFGNTDTNNVCLQLGGAGALANVFSHGGGAPDDFRLRKRFEATVRLPGYVGGTGQDGGSLAQVVAFIQGQNTGSAGEPGSAAASGAGGGYTGGAACTLPILAISNQENQSVAQLLPVDKDTVNLRYNPIRTRWISQQSTVNSRRLAVNSDSDSETPSTLANYQLPITNYQPLFSNETINFAIGTLPAGKSITIVFDVTVDDPFPPANNPACNQATITSNELSPVLTDDPDTGTANDPTCTMIDIEADLAITKTDGAATAVPGTSITYTITASNAGPYPDPAAIVTDTFPAAITGVTWTCEGEDGATCTGSGTGDINETVNLPVGGSVTFTAIGTIDPAATGTLANTAVIAVSTGLTDPDTTNNAATDSNNLTPQADLSITKTDSADPVNAGAAFNYTLDVTNNGPSTATTVSVADTLPAGVAFVTASGTGWTCNEAAGVVTCTRPTLAPGAAPAITINVIAPTEGGIISNTAVVSSVVTDLVPGNNSDTETTTVTPVADLAISKSDSADPVNAGAAFSYTLDVTNIGPSTATSLSVVDTLPAGVGFVSASGTGWSCGEAAGVVTCTRAALAPGAAPSITIDVTAPTEGGNLSNTATVSATEMDPVITNNSDTESTAVTGQADLSITKTDGQTTAIPGTGIIYTIVASNAGPSSAPTATVADTFPAALTGVTWTCVGAGGGTCTAAGSGNINDSANLPAGGSVTYTVSGTISAAATGTLSNTATVSSSVPDPNPANNSATDSNTLTPQADLSISKTDGLTAVAPGQATTYTITASNAGPSNAPGSTVADTFPAALTGVTWTCISAGGGTCTAAGAGNINDIVNLPAGDSVTYTVSATVDAGASGIISNTATVATPGGVTDPNPGNNSATDTTSIDAPPEITDFTVTPATINENDTVNLSVTFTDPNIQEAHEVVIDWGDGSANTVINLPIGTLTTSANHQYLDDNPTGTPSDNYTVTVTVNEADGGTDSDTAVVTVNNVAPTLSDVSAPAVDENELVTLSGDITDPGTQDTFTLLVDWGDGDSDTYNYPAGTTSFDEMHQYLDNGSFTITLTLTDDDTGSDNDTISVTVNNVAPTLSNVLITSVINENEMATLSGDITDPGTLDTFTLEVDWGDGITNTYSYPAGTTSFSETHLYADDDPTGTPSDIMTATLTLTDNDGGSDSDTASVTVNNIAPDLFNLAATPLLIEETNTITVTGQISDTSPLDTFVLTVDWGDGPEETFNYPAGTTSFLITHTYLDDTPAAQRMLLTDFTIELTLTDDDTGSDSETLIVQVDNVPPVLDNITITDPITEGDTATLSGDIIEVSPLDTFTLTVAWGDGTVQSFSYGAGTSGFSESHIYLDDNPTATPSDTYTATLTLVDDDGGTAVSVISFIVTNAPPVADAGADIAGYPGSTITFNGSFTDVGIEDTHTIEWDFGDGSTSSGSLTPTHVYTATGVYTATLTVTDDDTGVSSDDVVVTISGTRVYLPIIMANFSPGPDLVVSNLTAIGNNIQVVVTNQGNTAVTDDFWVDVYIDPDTVPTMVNQTWQLVGNQGLVWGVTNVTLNPGQSLTLTINGTHYRSDLSSFTTPLAAGTPIYAQVDSANTGTTYGSVLENHESSGGVYNNITAATVQ